MRLTSGSVSELGKALRRRPAFKEALASKWDDFETMLHAAIHGDLRPEVVDLVRGAHAGDRPNSRLDDATHALVRHMGLEPDVLTALSTITVINVEDRGGVVATFSGSARIVTPRMEWNSWGTLCLKPALPQSLEGAFRRAPLRDIVSHPALDGLDLFAEIMESHADETIIVVSGVRWMEGPPLPAHGAAA